MAERTPTVDNLLNLVPDAPDSVLSHLRTHPELASKQDRHGYSLLHAATSYEQLDLLRVLIEQYHVDPNLEDEDGETCLFNAETVDFAKELISLGVNANAKNNDGQTAAEKLDDEDEQPDVASFLRETIRQNVVEDAVTNGDINGASNEINGGNAEQLHPPPPLPHGVQVSIGTMGAHEVGGEPDPEFRRRIEQLAASQDFEGDQSQQELRDLVSDALSGLNHQGQGSATRRRLG